MSITAKELAGKLGISASAVSIALNGKKGISDEKRDFILRAAKEYGLKRPLRKSFSSTFINLVIFKKHGMVYGDTPFFAAVTEGISAEVANSGYNLQISYFMVIKTTQNSSSRSRCPTVPVLFCWQQKWNQKISSNF